MHGLCLTVPELKAWFCGQGRLADYLGRIVLNALKDELPDANGEWKRVIWDVTAVAWLLNDNDRFLTAERTNVRLPDYSGQYESSEVNIPTAYYTHINKEELFRNLVAKIRAFG